MSLRLPLDLRTSRRGSNALLGGRYPLAVRFLKSEVEREAEERAEAERLERDRKAERRWEYQVLRAGTKARAEDQLNDLGRRGWQLVQVVDMGDHLAFYLERELLELDETTDEDAMSGADAHPST